MAKTISVSDSLSGILKTINQYFPTEKKLYQIDNTEYKVISLDDFALNRFRVLYHNGEYSFIQYKREAA